MEHLQTLTTWQEFSHMVGVSVPQSCVPEADTIVIDSHRTIHHLVKSVAVQVGHIQRMVTLSGVSTMFFPILASSLVIGIETPFLYELPFAPVPRLDDGMTIDTSSEDYRGQPRLVEAPYPDTEGAGAFPIVITP